MATDLHWLYLHGNEARLAVATGGLVVGALLSRLWARAKAQRTLEGLEGTLEGGALEAKASDRISRQEGRSLRRADDGTSVMLSDEIQIVGATVEGKTAIRIDDGARITVKGKLGVMASTATDGSADYRKPSVAERIEGTTEICTRTKKASPKLSTLLFFAGFGAGVAMGGLDFFGRMGVSSPGDGTRLDLHALSSATSARQEGLRSLRAGLMQPPRTEARLHRAGEVSRLAGLPIAEAYLELGEVRLASDHYADDTVSFTACSTHIAARHWASALFCMRKLAAAESGQRAQALHCIGDWLEVRQGRAEVGLEALRKASRERAMCRVLLADISIPEVRLELLSDPNFSWAWSDANAMDFAKGFVVKTAQRLVEEATAQPLDPSKYGYVAFPEAVLAERKSWEQQHRFEWPVCLIRSLMKKEVVATNETGYRNMIAANVGQLYTTLGDFADARKVTSSTNDPTMRSMLLSSIDRIEKDPRLASRFLGKKKEDATVWGYLDEMAEKRREAMAAHPPNDPLGENVHSLRESLLDRETCVPLHMLSAWDTL